MFIKLSLVNDLENFSNHNTLVYVGEAYMKCYKNMFNELEAMKE